ncbi:MAG: bifunctional folylpolyglutamate synthase/dihydrofolate synthase [Rubricoccaceae bacterium]
MTYADAEALLTALPRFAEAGADAYRPGLERIRALLDGMGRPEAGLPCVHVAGTNGKGSTASMTASIGTAAGRRVGLHTSPHLLRLTERLRLNGAPAPDAWLADAVARYAPLLARVRPSFFEATVALSLRYFADAGADEAVVEVGLGGRLDATNALSDVRVSVVTHIGWDHADLLGGSLEAIAREKAGIARPDVPLLHGVPSEGALAPVAAALEAEARARGARPEAIRETVTLAAEAGGACTLETPARRYTGLRLGLGGAHQLWNAALAVRAAEMAWPGLPPEAVAVGLAGVTRLAGLRGRGETLAPDVLADVAHNADGWHAALGAARDATPGRLWALVALMADKDASALAEALAAHGVTAAFAVALPGGRALPAAALARYLDARGVPARLAPDAASAIAAFRAEASSGDRLLVTGSHVTVAEAVRALGSQP